MRWTAEPQPALSSALTRLNILDGGVIVDPPFSSKLSPQNYLIGVGIGVEVGTFASVAAPGGLLEFTAAVPLTGRTQRD